MFRSERPARCLVAVKVRSCLLAALVAVEVRSSYDSPVDSLRKHATGLPPL